MYHIGLSKEDVGEIALMPGDPDRVERIAKRFDDRKEIGSRRGFRSWGAMLGANMWLPSLQA